MGYQQVDHQKKKEKKTAAWGSWACPAFKPVTCPGKEAV